MPNSYIDIVIDGPPFHESGRFVEVENMAGESIRVGEWMERPNGHWALRLLQTTPQSTDHIAEARKHIDWAHAQQAAAGEFDETVQHNATLAIAEATLALVEQQRIANLIALEGLFTGDADPALYAEAGPEWGAARALRPEIKSALGIEAVA